MIRAPTEDILRHVEGIVHPLNTGPGPTVTQKRTNIYHLHNAVIKDSEDYIEIANIALCISLVSNL